MTGAHLGKPFWERNVWGEDDEMIEQKLKHIHVHVHVMCMYIYMYICMYDFSKSVSIPSYEH